MAIKIKYNCKSNSVMKYRIISIAIILFIIIGPSSAQKNKVKLVEYNDVICAASRLNLYLPLIKNKKVAIVANQSSLINNTHLVDSLITHNVDIVKILCPEHGFRGKADAGEKVNNDIDSKTKIPIISLYGSHKKPTNDDLKGIDIVLFDLQDVGTRFYTYISTLTYVMEACAEQSIPLLVLDRPNPNGYFIDGPILDKKYTSFVGLHPVPVVYGMTIGEYSKMVLGEKWINMYDSLDLKIIPLSNYNHNMIVKLATKPSPNLPNWQSVYLYPSLCFFEGTIMSVGRGTNYPFQIYGHPQFTIGSYVFTPVSLQGASKPPLEGKHCYGANLSGYANNYIYNQNQINLTWLIGAYEIMHDKNDFFTNYFEKLSGTEDLRKQIETGFSEKEIRETWQPGLDNFRKIRSKYLLYD